MLTLFSLTIFGSILTIFLILFKSILIKKYGGSWYYYIWILILIAFCLPYKINFVSNVNIINPLSFIQNNQPPLADVNNKNEMVNNATNTNQNNIVQINSEDNFKDFNSKISTSNIIIIIYFTGFTLFGLYYITSYILFIKKLKKLSVKIIDKEVIESLNKSCENYGIKKNILLYKSNLFSTPIFIGILNPMIVMPNKSYNNYELEMIFRHELTHYKRKDMFYKLISLIVNAIHWFNPISYLAVHNINESCEYSCDEKVVRTMDKIQRKDYGYILLNQANINKKHPSLLVGFSESDKNILKRRLLIIMENKKYKRIAITLLIGAIVLAGANLFGFQPINFGKNNKNIDISKRYIGNWEIIPTTATSPDEEVLLITEEQLLPFINLAEKEMNDRYDVSILPNALLSVSTVKVKDNIKIRLVFSTSQEYYDAINQDEVPTTEHASYALDFTDSNLEEGIGTVEYSYANAKIDRARLKAFEDKSINLFEEYLDVKFNPKEYDLEVYLRYYILDPGLQIGMEFNNGKIFSDKDYVAYNIGFMNADLSTGKGDLEGIAENGTSRSLDAKEPIFTDKEKQNMQIAAENLLNKIGCKKIKLLSVIPYSGEYGENTGMDFLYSFETDAKTKLNKIYITVTKENKVKSFDFTDNVEMPSISVVHE